MHRGLTPQPVGRHDEEVAATELEARCAHRSQTLVVDFAAAADRVGIDGWPCELRTELLPAPQAAEGPTDGPRSCVCVRAARGHVGASWWRDGPQGRQSGSEQRGSFQQPALCAQILGFRILWPWIGVDQLSEATVREWMLTKLDRTHVYVPAGSPGVLISLEMYVRARVGVYEGSATARQ
jgi:hypothetical protein